ncbi:hypothetical protein D3C73_906230 [compost metagenome]
MIDRFLQCRLRATHAARFSQTVTPQLLPGAHAEAFAEELRGQLGQLMGLVDDEGLRTGQQLAEALLLQREIGEQQMVVDHDQVGGLRTLAGTHDEAVIPEGALVAQAVVDGGGDDRQQRRVIGQAIEFSDIARIRAPRPGQDALELCRLFRAGKTRLTACLLQAIAAQVVAASLQQRAAQSDAQRLAHARQVTVIELVLQRAGTGGNDGAHSGQQHRHQIGKGLAGAGTGFGEQQVALLHRRGNGLGQAQLRRTRDECIQVGGERAAFAEGFAAGMDKIGHQVERIPGRALPGTRFKPEHRQKQRQQRLFMALGCYVPRWVGQGRQDTP